MESVQDMLRNKLELLQLDVKTLECQQQALKKQLAIAIESETLSQQIREIQQQINKKQRVIDRYQSEITVHNIYEGIQQRQTQILQALDNKLEGLKYYEPTFVNAKRHEKKVAIVKELRHLATINIHNLMQVAQFIVEYQQLCERHKRIEPSSKNLAYGGSRLGKILRDNDPSVLTDQRRLSIRQQLESLCEGEVRQFAGEHRLQLLYQYAAIIKEERWKVEWQLPSSLGYHFTRIVDLMCRVDNEKLQEFIVELKEQFTQALLQLQSHPERWEHFYTQQVLECERQKLEQQALSAELHGSLQASVSGAVSDLVRAQIVNRFDDTLLLEEKIFLASICGFAGLEGGQSHGDESGLYVTLCNQAVYSDLLRNAEVAFLLRAVIKAKIIEYSLCLMPAGTQLEPGKLYVRSKEDALEYTVIDPYGAIVTGTIDTPDLEKIGITAPVSSEVLQARLNDILKITSERKHTYRFADQIAEIRSAFEGASQETQATYARIGLRPNVGHYQTVEKIWLESGDNRPNSKFSQFATQQWAARYRYDELEEKLVELDDAHPSKGKLVRLVEQLIHDLEMADKLAHGQVVDANKEVYLPDRESYVCEGEVERLHRRQAHLADIAGLVERAQAVVMQRYMHTVADPCTPPLARACL